MAPRNMLYRLAFGGRLFETEGWSCSLHTDGNQVVTVGAAAFQPALVAWFSRMDSHLSAQARLDFIKYNRLTPFILPTGKTSMRYADPTTDQKIQNDMAVGGDSAPPGQQTLAVSLRTALSRGRAHSGRIYPPSGSVSVDITGRISTTVAAAVAASAATLIRDLNAVVAGQGTTSVVVFSNVGQVVENVQSIRVGRVYDTMRSRRTTIDEGYQSAPVNP